MTVSDGPLRDGVARRRRDSTAPRRHYGSRRDPGT
jgi:hypothetical protein